MQAVKNVHLVDTPAEGQATVNVFCDNMPEPGGDSVIEDGSITTAKIADKAVDASKIADGVLPSAATDQQAGIVKQAANVAAVSAPDAAVAASETVTKAEFDAVVTEANACKATINALIAALAADGCAMKSA